MADDIVVAERGVPFPATTDPVDTQTASGGMAFSLGNFVTLPNKDGMPGWWSAGRDTALRTFVNKSDPLKVAVNTFINKLVSVPYSIFPKDNTMAAHAELAAELEWNLTNLSGFMRGFREELKKIARDYLTADNGCFALVMGKGSAHRPLVGPALGVMHLDSARCQRTNDPEYPVIYTHINEDRYALHYTRVISMSNLPSSNVLMNGVGLCAVSCALASAQELMDITEYAAEKMGSRPPRQILYAKTGANISELTSAIAVFEQKMNADGYARFSKTVLLAPKSANQQLELDVIDLASVPDGFDRDRVSLIDLSLLAAAFGLDLHDLSLTITGTSTSEGGAEVQSKKGRGKGVHEFIETFTDQFARRFLPAYLSFKFDEVDDDADQQHADILATRATARSTNLSAGVTTLRVERVAMLHDGDISIEDFAMLELADGRTPDGMDILFLFYTKDPYISDLLRGFTVPEPTDLISTDAPNIVPKIREREIKVYQEVETARTAVKANKARMALYALQKLETMYMEAPPPELDPNNPDVVDATAAQDPAAVDSVTDPAAASAAANGDEAAGVTGDGADVDVDATAGAEGAETTKEAGNAEKQLPFSLTELPDSDQAFLTNAIDDYEDDFYSLVRQAQSGQIDEESFVRSVSEIAAAILLLLFVRGSKIPFARMTTEEKQEIARLISQTDLSASDFGRDLYGTLSASGKPMTLHAALARAGLWVNMAIAAFSTGQLMRRDNPRLEWVWNPMKDHCGDCVRLNGQVHTASQWRAAGWLPRSTRLECHGYNCGCGFRETKDAERGSF